MPCHVVPQHASCVLRKQLYLGSSIPPSSWLAHANSTGPLLPAGTHSGPRAGTTDALLNVARQVRRTGRMCLGCSHAACWQHDTAMAHDGAPHTDHSAAHVQQHT